MGILGIGVDVVHVPRIAAVFNRRGPKFPLRILSSEEHTEWLSLPAADLSARIRFLAVRWGLKEAAYKAMYSVARPTWKELTYRGKGIHGGKPALLYRPHVTSQASRIGPTHISVSHDGEYVFASVVVEVPKQGLLLA